MNPIKFKLALSRPSKSGECPIYLRFNHSDTELVYPTGEKCKPIDWDSDKQKFRRSMAGYQEANESLQLLREKLTTAYRKLRDTNELVTSDKLRAELRPEKKVIISLDLLKLFSDYLTHCKVSNYKPATLKSMGVSHGRLTRYVATGVALSVSSYTVDVHGRFLLYLAESL